MDTKRVPLIPETTKTTEPALPASAHTSSNPYPEADFYEPVEFAWTVAGCEARQALKTYSETPQADQFGRTP
jgi:hypothetical protein